MICKDSLGIVNSMGKAFLEGTVLPSGEWLEFEENKLLADGRPLNWIAYICRFEDYSKIDQSAFENADGKVTD